jgi:tRNA1(Val) A37 N6-methylase TrmN6
VEELELLGRCTLLQADGLPKLGTDSKLLAQFATLRPGWRVLDLGCGVGVLLLLLAERADRLTLDGVELEPRSAALAQENLTRNALTGTILQGDLREGQHFRQGHYDLIISNPPYFAAGTGYQAEGARGVARTDSHCSLPELCAAAGRRLKTGGRFALCLRPERLCELFAAMTAADLAPKRLRLVQARADKAPRLVLVEGVRQGGKGLAVEPVLLLE